MSTKADKNADKPIELKDETLALKKKLIEAKAITFAKDGTPNQVETIYVDTLPEEILEANIKKEQKHNTVFVAAYGSVFGEEANKAFAKNPDLQDITVKVPMVGRDHFEFHIQREKATPGRTNNGDVKGTDVQYGVMSAAINVASVRDSGEWSKVRKLIQADALAAYGS